MNTNKINEEKCLLLDIMDFLTELEVKLNFYSTALSNYAGEKDNIDIVLDGLLWASSDYFFEVVKKARSLIEIENSIRNNI